MLYYIMQATEDIMDLEKLTNHFDLSDEAFLFQMENGSLPPHLFNHVAHIRLAWILIDGHGEERAITKVCELIKNFDAVHGDGTKFHVTLTVASVKVVNHFMRKTIADKFKDFLIEFPQLETNFKQLLTQHYTEESIISDKGRHQFLEPDVLAFT